VSAVRPRADVLASIRNDALPGPLLDARAQEVRAQLEVLSFLSRETSVLVASNHNARLLTFGSRNASLRNSEHNEDKE
jgi:hypothetical protein